MYKDYFENKKGIFFDLDGTLVDSSELWDKAFRNVLAEIKYEDGLPDFPTGLHMDAKWDFVLRKSGFKAPFTHKELSAHTEKMYLSLFSKSPLPLREGFLDLVYKFKTERNLKLGLVSNSAKDVVDFVAQKLMIHKYFDVIVCGDEIKKPKPNPEIYKLALKKIGMKSKEVVAFEDSFVGVDAAINAGIDTFAVLVDPSVLPDQYSPKVKEVIVGFEELSLYLDTSFKDEMNAAIDFAKTYYEDVTPPKP